MKTTEQLAKIEKAQASLRKSATTALLPGARETLNDLADALDVVAEHARDIPNVPTRKPASKKTAAKR